MKNKAICNIKLSIIILFNLIYLHNSTFTMEIIGNKPELQHSQANHKIESNPDSTIDHTEKEDLFDNFFDFPNPPIKVDEDKNHNHSNRNIHPIPLGHVIDLSEMIHHDNHDNNEYINETKSNLHKNPFLKFSLPPFNPFENIINSNKMFGPLNKHEIIRDDNNNETEITEHSGPGFKMFEIKKHNSNPANIPFINHNTALKNNSPHHINNDPFFNIIKSLSRLGPKSILGNNINNTNNRIHSEIIEMPSHNKSIFNINNTKEDFFDMNSDFHDFQMKPIHIEIRRFPGKKHLQETGDSKTPTTGKLIKSVDNMMDSFFDSFLDNIFEKDKKQNTKLEGDKAIKAKTNGIDNLENIFDDFFGNDHEHDKNNSSKEGHEKRVKKSKMKSNINQKITKTASKLNEKQKTEQEILKDSHIKDNNNSQGEINKLVNKEDNSIKDFEIKKKIDSYDKQINKEDMKLDSSKKDISLNKATAKDNIKSKDELITKQKRNEKSSNVFKNYLENNYFNKLKNMSKKEAISGLLKIVTWAVILLLSFMILYVFVWIVLGAKNDFSKPIKANYNIDELEDELKSINRSKKNKYY